MKAVVCSGCGRTVAVVPDGGLGKRRVLRAAVHAALPEEGRRRGQRRPRCAMSRVTVEESQVFDSDGVGRKRDAVELVRRESLVVVDARRR